MAEERRKGVPDRRRARGAKAAQAGEETAPSAADGPDVHANEQTRADNPNEAAAFDADQLDATIRARQQEDRGEVF
jgi:hypothetical protein